MRLVVPGRSDGEAGDVAASVTGHEFVKLGIGFTETVDIGIVLFAFGIIDFKGTTFFGEFDRRTVSRESKRLMN